MCTTDLRTRRQTPDMVHISIFKAFNYHLIYSTKVILDINTWFKKSECCFKVPKCNSNMSFLWYPDHLKKSKFTQTCHDTSGASLHLPPRNRSCFSHSQWKILETPRPWYKYKHYKILTIQQMYLKSITKIIIHDMKDLF